MLSTTIDFVKNFQHEHPFLGKVLDVGSLDVNGNIRNEFQEFEYVGVDMRPGPNVDKVVNGHDLKKVFKEGEFDIVVCFDTLEHDDMFWITVENMKWVLKKGGWLLVGTPSINHPRHNHPYDYYRFTKDSFRDFIFKDMNNAVIHEEYYNAVSNEDYHEDKPDQVFGWGQKI